MSSQNHGIPSRASALARWDDSRGLLEAVEAEQHGRKIGTNCVSQVPSGGQHCLNTRTAQCLKSLLPDLACGPDAANTVGAYHPEIPCAP